MSDREDELILELIIQEERKRTTDTVQTEQSQKKEDATDERESDYITYEQVETEPDDLTFIEERNVNLKTGVWNTPESEDDLGDFSNLPLELDGKIENFLVVADKPDFSIRVEVDDHDILDDEYSFIESISNELSKVSAYKSTDNTYVVSVMDYDFSNRFNALIKPNAENVTFEVIRVEIERG